jgi:hypothetical protein
MLLQSALLSDDLRLLLPNLTRSPEISAYASPSPPCSSFIKTPKTPMTVAILLEAMGGSSIARASLPHPSLLCGEVRGGGATCRAYQEEGIDLV